MPVSGVRPNIPSPLSTLPTGPAQKVNDTHKVVGGATTGATYWSNPPSNDSGLFNYVFTLSVPDQATLKKQIPGFDPATAKPFIWAPNAQGAWSSHGMEAFDKGWGPGPLKTVGEYYTGDLPLNKLKSSGVAFGIDVPNSNGGVDRYWLQAPTDNTRLQVVD